MGLRVLNKNILNSFRPEYCFYLSNARHLREVTMSICHCTSISLYLQFPPVKVIFGQSDPQSDPGDVKLLAIVNGLPEYVVVLWHLLLVDLPGEVGGGVGGLTAAVELQEVSYLILLHVHVCRDSGGLVWKF